ncbi:DUF3054 domain-containing protein [Mycobacterium sp. CBMA293]|uniref:DUF3054 domain-containing protein n=1 Tax=unclassified Mycolicibacterium TaxID=2636767 RepID=UPI0012DD3E49|nr:MULTISPECIES: DUF3054 domain-containing protein [unclassified Mycolicibacterium]MUL47439.1 DUF3054 domain-containing protein [Mycolicibacterium sp. CBMA 360]MUL59425.1 DUF3054 domain-containing protein [Mycolicibacterium sp. CBMA 335]MUL71150.1 DUF3054 domain-containing protein [Mycolicibacterium sp. CBMA 311]MUL94793.1 DUF3054 domain-containing protein [Mycolicibacterium sp. CBMA 230]MUM03634.1 hypothetical protein [Mycolicibacterium sp. CBMA 213]
MTADQQTETRSAARAFLTDVVLVVIFCAIGRRSHAEGITLAGVAHTSWPFLTGTMAGWALSQGWRRPTALIPTGLAVWVSTIVIGMLLRKASAQGVAVSFVIVASTVTAIFLLGWRGVAALLRRRGQD